MILTPPPLVALQVTGDAGFLNNKHVGEFSIHALRKSQLLTLTFSFHACVTAVFGQVLEGMSVVHFIENVRRDGDDRPLEEVIIKESGEIAV